MARRGMPYTPPINYAKVDPERAKRIAAAFEAMEHNPGHPLTHAAYDAMVRETMDQYVAAKRAGFRPEFWPSDHEDPYGPSPRLAIEDINKNNHMFVYPTRLGYGAAGADEVADNPLLQDSGERWNGRPATVNDIFRATHDYYGHAKEGVGFRHDGEENAWRAHAAMYSPLARIAMTNETRGQNSWVNFGPHGEHNQTARGEDTIFAPQKIGHLPPWAVHEGVEDHMPPEDRARVEAAYRLLPRPRRQGGGQIQPLIAPSDVFDMSLLHETPNVPQFDLPRYEPKKGPPARVADLIANKRVREQMHERIHRGRLVGSIWYNAEPLRREFVKAHGEEVGNRIFRRYMDYVAATSPRSQVPANARNASYYLHRDITGQGMPTGERVFGPADPKTGLLKKLPQPYGHKAQDSHIRNANLVFSQGWDPMRNPKPRSFVENLVGNQRPGTIDAHAFKLPAILAQDPRFLATALEDDKTVKPRQLYEAGDLPMHEAIKRAAYWASKPGDPEYAAMERYYQGLGHEAGLTTAQTQASGWVGGGEETGLKSPPNMPFMTALHERVMDTAKQRNMDPRDVVQRFVRGAQPLLATGGRVGRADGGELPGIGHNQGPSLDDDAPNPVNTETQSRVGAVRFDQKDGAGQVPNNQNVNYLGFTAMMKPSKFLSLSHKLENPTPGRIEALRDHLAAGNAIGSPFLRVDYDDDGEDMTFGKVRGHDGRHRMRAIQALQGDTPVPVHVFGTHGDRARHLTPEQLAKLRARMIVQGSTRESNDNFEDAFHLGKVLPGRPQRAGGGGFPHATKPHVFHSNLHGHHLHVGPIHSAVHGRTDHLPMHVPSGSYVLPADVVSAHGEGNTTAGFRVMRRLFGGAPYGGSGGPYNSGAGPYGEALQNSRGGRAQDGAGDAGVPIVAAGGEYVLSPDQVRAVGHGDAELGTKVLDEFVKRSRSRNIKTLQRLPGPAKD